MRYRNDTLVEFSLFSLFVMIIAMLLHVKNTTQCCNYTWYKFKSFKVTRARGNIYICSFSYINLISFLWFLPLFILIHVDIKNNFLNPIHLCSPPPPLCCYWKIYYISICYSSNSTMIYFKTAFKKLVKRRKKYALILPFIIT